MNFILLKKYAVLMHFLNQKHSFGNVEKQALFRSLKNYRKIDNDKCASKQEADAFFNGSRTELF